MPGRIKWSWRKTWDQRKGIPIRENCDPLNPRQALLWMFTGVGVRGAPIALPVEFWEVVSEHIIECSGVEVVETIERIDGKKQKVRRLAAPFQFGEPRRKYHAPTTVMNRAAAAGAWVTMDTPDPERKSAEEQLEELAHKDQVDIAAAVITRMFGSQGSPDTGPELISIETLAQQLTLEPFALVKLLQAWGVENIHTGSRIDRATAIRVSVHYNRARGTVQ